MERAEGGSYHSEYWGVEVSPLPKNIALYKIPGVAMRLRPESDESI